MYLNKNITTLVLVLFLSLEVFSQPLGYELFGNLYESNSSKIELWVKKPKISCDSNAKKFKFILIPINARGLSNRTGNYLSWKIDIVSCSDYLITKSWSEDISQFLNQSLSDQPWEKMDWDFDAKSIDSKIYSNVLTSGQKIEKDKNHGLKLVIQPKIEILGPISALVNEEITLTVKGDMFSSGAQWYWYKDDCSNSLPFAKGNEIKVRPTKTTTYFVRAEDGIKKTSCIEHTITIDNNSRPPKSITSTDGDLFCLGSSKPKILTVNGGRLASNAQWVWYENKIEPGKQRYKGSSIAVSPTKLTTYIVRAEASSMQPTDTVNFTIKVVGSSSAPKYIELSKVNIICEGDLITLKVNGGRLGESSNWSWSKKSINAGIETTLSDGASIMDKATESAIYTVVAVGACEIPPFAKTSINVNVNVKSVNPSTSDVVIRSTKSKNLITIPENSGTLGPSSQWVWYKDASGEHILGTGNNISTNSTADKILYLRSEGICNKTDLIPIPVKGLRNKKFNFIDAGIISDGSGFNPNRISNFSLAFGLQDIYVKLSFAAPGIYGKNADDITKPTFEYDGSKISNYPSNTGTYYLFNEKIYSNTQLYNIGILKGSKWFKLYFGVGYGTYNLYWSVNTYKYGSGELISEKWANYSSKKLSGPSMETGAFVKLGHVNLMTGINGIYSFQKSKQFISGYLGLGFVF